MGSSRYRVACRPQQEPAATFAKLPPKDRLGALETELGGARLAVGLSPEQWLRSKVHKYYLLAFLATCGVVVVTLTLAIMNRSPVSGATYINSPDNMRVPAVWNNLGVAYLGLGDQPRARAAFEKARERNPNDDAANANLSHLNKAAAITPAVPQDTSSQPKPAEGRPVAVQAQAKQPEINLLASDLGGQLLAAPNEKWTKRDYRQ
jgi:hypothetical protein